MMPDKYLQPEVCRIEEKLKNPDSKLSPRAMPVFPHPMHRLVNLDQSMCLWLQVPRCPVPHFACHHLSWQLLSGWGMCRAGPTCSALTDCGWRCRTDAEILCCCRCCHQWLQLLAKVVALLQPKNRQSCCVTVPMLLGDLMGQRALIIQFFPSVDHAAFWKLIPEIVIPVSSWTLLTIC